MDSSNTANKNHSLTLVVGILIALFYYQAMDYIVFYHLKSSLITLYCHDLLICSEVILLYFYSKKVENKEFLVWPEKQRSIQFYIISIISLFLIASISGVLGNFPKWFKWHELWNMRPSRHFMKVAIEWYQQSVFICILSTALWSVATELIFRGYLLPR